MLGRTNLHHRVMLNVSKVSGIKHEGHERREAKMASVKTPKALFRPSSPTKNLYFPCVTARGRALSILKLTTTPHKMAFIKR